MKPDDSSAPLLGVAGRVARLFIDSKLTPLIVVTSVLLGLFAVIMLPREEEPQIKVPMIDVLVSMPGFSAKEVEERATRPMEKLLWEIPGVEYIYSTSRTGESQLVVRFQVGEDIERSLVRLTEKLPLELRSHPGRCGYPAHQAEVHRRRADSHVDVPQPALRPSHAAASRRAGGRHGEAGAIRSQKPRSSAAPDGNCACCSIRQGSPRAISLRRVSFRC